MISSIVVAVLFMCWSLPSTETDGNEEDDVCFCFFDFARLLVVADDDDDEVDEERDSGVVAVAAVAAAAY